MKRFAKGCLILVVSLVIAGVVLLCVAAGGGVNRATFRNLSNQHALRFGPFCVYMDGPLSWHLTGRSEVGTDYEAIEGVDATENLDEATHHSVGGSHTTTHYEFETSDIRSVSMDLNGAKVKVLPAENDRIQVDVKQYEHTEHDVELSGNTLDIYYDRVDNFIMNVGHGGTEVVIYLPENFQADSYALDIDASEVDIETVLCAQNVSMNIDASDVECSKTLQADEKLELDVDAGSLSMSKVLCNGAMSANCNVGNLEVDGECYGNVSVDVDAGNAEFDLKGQKGINYAYALKGNLSDMEVNGQEYDELDTDINIQGDAGAPFITLSCDAGSLEFKLK